MEVNFDHSIFMMVADISIEVLNKNSRFKDYIGGCNYVNLYLS